MRVAMQKLLLRERKASVRSRVGCVLLQQFKRAVRCHCCCRCCCWAATLGAKAINVETHVNESHRPEMHARCMCVRAVSEDANL